LFLSASTLAAEPELDRFRVELDAFMGRLGRTSNGVVKWVGSDRYEVRRDGEIPLAIIENAQLSFEPLQTGRVTFDHIEIREIGRKEEDKLIELTLTLPKQITFSGTDGTQIKITLEGARANAVVDRASGRARETAIEIASARIEPPDSGAWVSLGPLSMVSKLTAEPNGGWSEPVEFKVKEIEYFLPQVSVSGGIERIAFSGRSAGPRLSELDKLRDALDRLQTDDTDSPQGRVVRFLATLPKISKPFGAIRGELELEGLTVRSAAGEALITVATAGSTAETTGLDAEEAALRFSMHHDGFDLAPSILENWKVPRRVVLDLGLADLSTRALIDLLQAVIAGMDQRVSAGSESEGKKQQAIQEALVAAAMLNPTFHVYDIAIDTEDVGVDLTAEAKGSPLAPKGYAASGDLAVRGFDEIPKLSGEAPFAEYLSVLREIGIESVAPDGTPRLLFYFSSVPPKWITINGNDVDAWFGGTRARAGEPRVLKPSDPPMQGNDVKSIQRALAAANISVDQGGVYNPATAGAVARFQKQKGMNVTGIVDAATRQRLGGEGDRQGSRN